MSLLAIDLALFERLSGAPLDTKGRPITDSDGIPLNRSLPAFPYAQQEDMPYKFDPARPGLRRPSYGVRIPLALPGRDQARGRTRQSSNSFHPYRDFSPNTYRQVPVFPFNIQGQAFPDVWPCVSFYWIGEDFNASTYLFWDPIGGASSDAAMLETTPSYGGSGSITGPSRLQYRAHPESVDLTYDIRVWAKDYTELQWLCDQVMYLFPARGVIEVEQMDGSTIALDMVRDRIENLDAGYRDVTPGHGGEEQREFSRSFTYRVEGYIDNTVNGYGHNDLWSVNVIRGRILELVRMEEALLEQLGVVIRQAPVTPPLGGSSSAATDLETVQASIPLAEQHVLEDC